MGTVKKFNCVIFQVLRDLTLMFKNLKRKRKPFEIYKDIKISNISLKSRSNSSSKAEKQKAQILNLKLVNIRNFSSLENSCDLSLQKLSYKSTEINSKIAKLEKRNMLMKTNIFKKHNRYKVLIKKDETSSPFVFYVNKNRLAFFLKKNCTV